MAANAAWQCCFDTCSLLWHSAACGILCTHPKFQSPPQDGSYRFHARVAGSSGADGNAAVSTFAIDSVAPTATFEGELLGCEQHQGGHSWVVART